MAKIDKSLLSKAEWKRLREFRRREKQKAREQSHKNRSIRDTRLPVQEQTAPVIDSDKNLPIKQETKTHTNENFQGENAFVLGNGTSRKPVDPEKLRSLGKIYGCNALYRTFDPDYLVAVDVKMVLELNKAGYQRKNANVWTNPNKSLLKYKGFNFFNPSKGWSSGPTALWLASQHSYQNIYILGFDFRGLEDGARFNNIYADTYNYKKSTDSATFFGNWMRQTQNVIRDHPHINYIRVIAPDNYSPPELNKFENYSTLLLEDFLKKLENF